MGQHKKDSAFHESLLIILEGLVHPINYANLNLLTSNLNLLTTLRLASNFSSNLHKARGIY